VLFAVGFAYFLAGDYDGATVHLKRTLAVTNKHHQARYVLALCLYRRGRKLEARRMLRGLAKKKTPVKLRRLAQARLRQMAAGSWSELGLRGAGRSEARRSGSGRGKRAKRKGAAERGKAGTERRAIGATPFDDGRSMPTMTR
jgi:hypothetical protein